jgi:hypothetical protein
MSREGWNRVHSLQTLSETREIEINVVETLSLASLRAEIVRSRPSILIISAHGAFDPKGSVASLLIGNEHCLGPGIGPLPPVVILSACSAAPRGASTVSITDMLLREGAIAVLGTQVPVDVRRNTMLTARFLLYVSEALAGRTIDVTLLDAWHQAQGSNAINDILHAGNPTLATWAVSQGDRGTPVIQDFMSRKSVGRLRKGHIYADSEEVLGEMADECGVGPRIRNILSSSRYVPESLFYIIAGWPDRVFLRRLDEQYSDDLRPLKGDAT